MKSVFILLLILLVCENLSGQTLQTNMPAVNGRVDGIIRHNNTIYIGGEFTTVGTEPRENLAAIDAHTGAVLPWAPNPDGRIRRMVLGDNQLIVKGEFTSIAGASRTYLALFDLPSNVLNPISVAATQYDDGVYWDGTGKIYFVAENEQRIRRFNNLTGVIDSWASDAFHISTIYAISIFGNNIYAGGNIYSVNNDYTLRNFTRFNASSGAVDANFKFNFGGSGDWVKEIVPHNGKLYITGSFSLIDSQSRRGVAEFDTLGNLTSLQIPISNSQNYALFPQGNTIWIGGNSAQMGGTYAYRIKQIDLSTGLATCWNTMEMSSYSYVPAIWVSNDTVYAGGSNLPFSGTGFRVFNGNDSWTTLGPDTLVCPDSTYTIQADPTFTSFLWSTGETTSSITVDSAGKYWVTGTRANNCKAIDTIQVQFCTMPVGISLSDKMDFSISPNPVHDFLNISYSAETSGTIEVIILNAVGQQVKHFKQENLQGKNKITISTSEMPEGLYFIRLSTGGKTATTKFLKLK